MVLIDIVSISRRTPFSPYLASTTLWTRWKRACSSLSCECQRYQLGDTKLLTKLLSSLFLFMRRTTNKTTTIMEMNRNTQARMMRNCPTWKESAALFLAPPGGAIERSGLNGFDGAGWSLCPLTAEKAAIAHSNVQIVNVIALSDYQYS